MRRGFLRRWGVSFGVLTLIVGSLLGLSSSVALAAPLAFNVACGDVAGLAADITAINGNADGGTITLAPGCTYTLTTPATAADGLPIITGRVIIQGQGATITRDSTAADFRIFEVASGGTLTLDWVTVSNGNTSGLGGGLLLDTATAPATTTAIVVNSTFTGNTASDGGGIAAGPGSHLTLTTTTVSGNKAIAVWGGGLINFGTTLITRSTFNANTAVINGGGINNQGSGLLTMVNSTLVGNTSGSIGGAIANVGTAALTNLTFSGNSGSQGDAIATGNPLVTLANSIIDDQAGHGECSLQAGPITDAGYNLASDSSCISASTSQTISASHPLTLGPLQFNGGQTQTLLPSAGSTGVIDQIPLAGCVATDASNPGQTTAVTTDQPGVNRPQGARCDIGAVEVPHPTAERQDGWVVLTTAVYDAQRNNISSPGLVVHALTIVPLDQPWNGANGNFQRPLLFSPWILPGGGYETFFNAQTLSLSPGTYALSYEIAGDPAVYIIEFTVS